MSYDITYSQNNIIGLIILLIVFINLEFNRKKRKTEEKLFSTLIVSTSLIIIADIIMNALIGTSGYLRRESIMAVTMIYFILNPIPFMAWSLYVDFYIHRSVRRLKKITPIVAIPAIVSITLCIFSIFNKGIFHIDENNLYNRGKFFWINASIYYSYFLITYLQIVIKRKSMRRKDYYSLLTFAIAPAIAGVLQIMNSSQGFLWLGVSISVLIIFIIIQNNELNKDYLTGLYNRRQLDRYLKNSVREIKKDELIFMIMMDLNYFKDINDTYGHMVGDEALKHTANILIDSFRSEDFISRYAGDEFIIIVKLEDEKYKKLMINRLRKDFEKFNLSNITPYDISISLGYDIYNPDLQMNADNFIIHIDKLMYKDKERIKGENIMREHKSLSY